MESGSKTENALENSVKNLKIDVPSKVRETSESVTREGSASDATSCISSADATTSSIKESEVDQDALMGEHGMYYYGYCYPGFSDSFGDWNGQSYYITPDNGESQPSAVQTDNGSLLYYLPGYEAGYSSYNQIIPGAVVGADGQYLGQPSYYPAPVLQQPLGSPGFVPQSVAYGPELVPAYPWDSSVFFANGYQSNGFYGDPTTPSPKPSFSSRSQTHPSSKTSTSSKSTTSETKGPSHGLDVKLTPAVPKQSLKPFNKGAAPVFSKGFIPVNKIPSYTNHGKGGVLYPNSPMNVKENGRIWVGPEKVKARNKLNGFGEFDLLSEQNRGPRTNSTKHSSNSSVDIAGSPDAGKNGPNSALLTPVKDLYNLPDFTTDYDHAMFFVIKSYSEDDIHKSIKYNVWASTPNGNRRLDNAFQLAQEKIVEKGGKCPVFLFFSVNASGQFCGVAEMLDRVDFDKSMDFWQQDKWNGFFPVKWHVIKDVPNPQFRHILLENNENKPVTNSRDTQEVKYPQGTEMLKIFKSYSSKTSILDDFDFYETRQKVMHHKRNKLPSFNFDHPSPKTEEVALDAKPENLKSVSILQPAELEAGKVEGQLLTVSTKE